LSGFQKVFDITDVKLDTLHLHNAHLKLKPGAQSWS